MKKGDFKNRREYHGQTDYQENKPQTLAEQLKEFDKSPDQKRREQSWYDWYKDLLDFITNSDCSLAVFQYASNKYKMDLENFHKKGSTFKEVLLFINSKSTELRDK